MFFVSIEILSKSKIRDNELIKQEKTINKWIKNKTSAFKFSTESHSSFAQQRKKRKQNKCIFKAMGNTA